MIAPAGLRAHHPACRGISQRSPYCRRLASVLTIFHFAYADVSWSAAAIRTERGADMVTWIARRIVFISLIFTLFTLEAYSQGCSLSGKSIIYIVNLCYNNGQCGNIGEEKITILGEKVLYYSDTNSSIGQTYLLGRNVDFCNSQYGSARDCQSPDPRGRLTATGYANFQGSDLTLVHTANLFVSNSQTPIAKYVTTVSIRTYACSSCEVANITMTTPDPSSGFYLSNALSCRVVPAQ